jgi:hypothetical protein
VSDIYILSVTIRSSCGSVVTADRASIYVFGQWMGRADLAYCMQNGKQSSYLQKLEFSSNLV